MSVWLGPRIRYQRPRDCLKRIHVQRGGDEYCNDTIMITAWPLGHLDIWWRWRQRTRVDGMCESCRADARESGCCEWCGSRPCHCDGVLIGLKPAEQG